MATPGFTAEYGLYRSSRTYNGGGLDGGDHLNDMVVPALCNDAAFEQCIARNTPHMSPGLLETYCLVRYGCLLKDDICVGIGANKHCEFGGTNYCGGVPCPFGNPCCAGTCCSPGDSCCDNACRNLASDPHHCGTCGNSCGTGQCCYRGKCTPPPNELGSSGNNYVLNSPGCKPIEGLTVSMQVQGENLTTSNGGFSMQLNAYNPQPITSTCPTNWMQFIIQNVGGQLSASIQYSVNGSTFNPFQWLPLTDTSGNPISTDNPMLIGQKLKIALDYDDTGANITGADFFLTETDGKTVLGHTYMSAPGGCLYAVLGFQVNIVSAPGLPSQPTFSAGSGAITYSTSGQQLCNEGATVGADLFPDVCSGTWVKTYENINVTYGAISSCCGSELTQPFSST
jgi:hypothetical protein